MVYNLESYTPKPGESFLFDTNIWIYLYSPVTSYHYALTDKFSSFMWKCIENRCNIYITSLILSEFYNTVLRIEFKNNTNKHFKNSFRNNQHLTEDISFIMEKCILEKAVKLDDSFSNIDLTGIKPEYDFNDYYLAKLCEKYNIKIVTNDTDFKQFSDIVDIIMLDCDYLKKTKQKISKMEVL